MKRTGSFLLAGLAAIALVALPAAGDEKGKADEKGNETAPTHLELLKPGPIEYRYFPYTSPHRHCSRR